LKDIKIGMAQINSIIGDFEGNFQIIKDYLNKAQKQPVDLLIFPELTVSGYPPQDLIYREEFIARNRDYLNKITTIIPNNMMVVIGFIDEIQDNLYNAAALIQHQKIVAVQHKTLLPNYDVFDEKRYFTSADSQDPVTVDFKGEKLTLGLQICEDLWDQESETKITKNLVDKGAELIINISASPFEKNKRDSRNQLVFDKVQKYQVPFVLVNYCGAQDEIIFAGNSIACDKKGNIVALGKEFREGFFTGTIREKSTKSLSIPQRSVEAAIFNALVLGVRDYFRKTGHTKAILGLSGGIDSAVVAAIAAAAIGPENLTCIAMPSQYTAEMSNTDAEQLAKNLGANFRVIPIEKIYHAFEKELEPLFIKMDEGITEENIQSRARGNIQMAVANKFGALVLNTGNKTELALGYCTMYGDMTGAIGVIGDLNKLEVYSIARYLNKKQNYELIPERIITRPPTAELKSEQVDPFDYNVVAPLVDKIINNGSDKTSLMKTGYPEEVIDDCLRRIRFSEYKRNQAAPALKVSRKAFGIGRRYPIVNKY